MEITKRAVAGTLESSDLYVMIEPWDNGIEFELESVVMGQYGESIKQVVYEILQEYGIKNVKISINDKGAIDSVIRSRIQTVISRSVGKNILLDKEMR